MPARIRLNLRNKSEGETCTFIAHIYFPFSFLFFSRRDVGFALCPLQLIYFTQQFLGQEMLKEWKSEKMEFDIFFFHIFKIILPSFPYFLEENVEAKGDFFVAPYFYTFYVSQEAQRCLRCTCFLFLFLRKLHWKLLKKYMYCHAHLIRRAFGWGKFFLACGEELFFCFIGYQRR